MLAQNFMTAADLGIRDAEVEALIKTLRLLECGELRDDPGHEHGGFNMCYWPEPDRVGECGTPACIGGWVSHFLGYDISNSYGSPGLPCNLCDLFFMSSCLRGYSAFSGAWRLVDASHAAIALRNYLTEGSARWDDVLAA